MQMPFAGVVPRVRHLLLLGGSLVLAACGGQSDSVPAGEFSAPVVEFQLVFSDEFNGSELDQSKWNIVEGDGCPDLCGFGNNELQVYSADSIDVSGGTLKITALDNPPGSDAPYTSARINTKDKFEFRYGRVEFSARLPSGQGMWPALWMLHADESVYGPWPAGGEIDVMEAFNPGVAGNTATQSTTHYGLPGPPFNGTSSQNDNQVPLDAAFHEYAVEWERDQLRFFVDGVHFQTQTSDEWYAYFPADEDGFYDPLGAYKVGPRDAPFDQMFYLIMNLAVGGNPVGPPEGTQFPQTLEVDYVRVYQCANANADTGRGCGTGDRTVVPLEDNDGGPLEGVPTDNPYVERLDLFTDGPEALSLTTPDGTSTNQLFVTGFTGEGAQVINDPTFADPSDDTNTVWRVAISGGVANAYLASQDLSEDPILDTGFDFSGFRTPGVGADPFGEVAFDMEIVSIDPGATILIKLDSGFPNLGEYALPATALAAPGVRKTYSVKFEQFLQNPGFVDCCGGTGVDLANVVNPFVIEVVGGAAEVYLDNIYVTNACKVIGGCGADLKSRGVSDLVVFDDEVNTAVWNRGLVAADSGTGFADYTDGTNPANKVNFAIVAAEDAARGNVIEATFNDSGAFGVFFVGSNVGVDVSTYGGGALVFDLLVTDYGTNTTGMT
ncbi:MAG: glycoside hydrolase family 16 protein, partial [Pseudomonadales bacterium]